MANIDQLCEKFPNYRFIKENKRYFVGIGQYFIQYDEELSLEIHNNINLIIDNCQSYSVNNNEFIFQFPLFKLCTNLYEVWIVDECDNRIYLSSLKDLIKTYNVLNNMAKIFKETYYNYSIEITYNLEFIVSFGVMITKDLGVSYKVHETIVELKKFLDANGKSDEDPEEYGAEYISYNFDNYDIDISLNSYGINTSTDLKNTTSSQEIIDYVKEHSPELFVNKLAELHM
jgi:hypothetical protein